MQHILIMGSGAVGGYYGAQLARSEEMDVTFIARGAHLEMMNKQGLRITGKESLLLDDVMAIEDPSRMNNTPDIVLFTVKSFDTARAIEQLRPVVKSHTQILTIQNGLENYELLAETFGSQNVIRGFCRIGVELTEPGVIDYRGMSQVVFGEENGTLSNRVLRLQKVMEHAGITCSVSQNIRKETWLKFIWNGIFNMLTGLANVTTDRIFQDDHAYATSWQLFFEMQAIAGAMGVQISDKEGRSIIDETRELGEFRTSTFQDRQRGKPLEFDAFSGYIVRKAEEYEISVPVNQTLYSLYKLLDKPT